MTDILILSLIWLNLFVSAAITDKYDNLLTNFWYGSALIICFAGIVVQLDKLLGVR